MSTTYDQIQAGWSAHGRDGDKIGEIEEIGQNYLLVTKGLIFPKDLYIPMSNVQSVDASEGQVILDVDKSQVDDMGWDQPPEATGSGSWDTTSATYDTQTTDAGTADYATTDASYASNEASYASTQQTTGTDYTQAEGDTLRVPVHEEQLRAERTADQAGEVRVDRNVVEEQRSIDVPVTREEVEVRRVPVSGSTSADASAFQSGDTIRVPVTEEQVHVTKEPRVVEEIEISKRQVTENQRVSDTVRREEVNVDDSSVRSGMGTTGTTGTTGYSSDASYATGTTGTTSSYDTGTTSDDDRSRGSRGDSGEVGGEAIGGGAGALGGAVIGGVVGGPVGAAVGGVIGGAGGAVAGESAEGGDEQGGSGVGGAAGALGGAVVGGAVAGPPGAIVGGAVGAGAGSGAGDKATEDDDDTTRR